MIIGSLFFHIPRLFLSKKKLTSILFSIPWLFHKSIGVTLKPREWNSYSILWAISLHLYIIWIAMCCMFWILIWTNNLFFHTLILYYIDGQAHPKPWCVNGGDVSMVFNSLVKLFSLDIATIFLSLFANDHQLLILPLNLLLLFWNWKFKNFQLIPSILNYC